MRSDSSPTHLDAIAPTTAPSSSTRRAEHPPALRVALGEYDTGWHDPATSLARAARVVERGARAGARLVVLPEMCTTGFTMDASRWTEPLDGDSARRLGALARTHGVWLVAGLAERDQEGGTAYNAAALFDPAGHLAAAYRKQRLFAYAGEDGAYAPGACPLVVTIDGVRVSPFVCYDLRFPELFRAVAREVDAFVIIANWPADRRMHWDVLARARAIENQCYVVAVNRIGEGKGLHYDGGSAAYGPWGDVVAQAAPGGAEHDACTVDLDPARVAEVRARYPFLADQRGCR